MSDESRIKLAARALRKVEWAGEQRGPGSGPMFSGGDGQRVRCCPACRGIDPSDPFKGEFVADAHGHRPGCVVAAALRATAAARVVAKGGR